MLTTGLGTVGFVFNGQVVRARNGEYLTTLYGTFEGDSRYSLVLAESADGFRWRLRAQIAGRTARWKGAKARASPRSDWRSLA
jgi:hypothetical protein